MENSELEGLQRWANRGPGPTAEERLAAHEKTKKAYAELIRKREAGEYVSDGGEDVNEEGNIVTPRRKGRMVKSLTDTSGSPAKSVASTTEGASDGEAATETLAKPTSMVARVLKLPGSTASKRKVLEAELDDPSDDANTDNAGRNNDIIRNKESNNNESNNKESNNNEHR
ncbi:MAG: hypothetical protein M1815_004356 [Lichina confinis]|nr:MAG: hypothetical protein M1815_004356 [Lichina confinis]